MASIRECLSRELVGKVPFAELLALEEQLNALAGVRKLLGEALTSADEDKIEQIVKKTLKSKQSEEQFLKFAKNVLTSLFKSLYVRRSVWRDGLVLAPD